MPEFTGEFGQRAAERLRTEEVIWLTTVGNDGMPQPSPVWFLWEGETAIIYSRPATPKLRNVTRHPQVALNFNSDSGGDNIIILTGTAEIATDIPPVTAHASYLAKYGTAITRIGMTPERFAAEYSAVIRVTPTKLRGH